jgi:hypothetical protein
MGDPAQSFAPDRYLEMLLREKYPERKFEVVNVAFTAINSHVILPIARECAAHEGDLWIIYMGNNEMVGPFGAATVFGRQAPPLPYARLVTALQRLRMGQWLTEQGRKFTAQGHAQPPGAAWRCSCGIRLRRTARSRKLFSVISKKIWTTSCVPGLIRARRFC